MKKLFYILSVAAAAALTLVSCQEKELLPREDSPAEVANCYGVYFPAQEASGDHVFSPVEEPVMEITVARINDKGNITVPVKTSFSEDGIFVADKITFVDGQKETTFQVRFPEAKEGVKYAASFVIEDTQYASIYNSNPIALDFSIMRVKMEYFLNPKTKEPAKVTFTQGDWNEVHTAYIKFYEVDGIRHCVTEQEELVGEGSKDGGFWGQDPNVHFEFDWYLGGDEECSCDEGSHSSLIPEGIDGVPAGAQMIRVQPRGIVDYGGGYLMLPYDYFSYYQDKNAYARGFLHFIDANELYDSVSYYDGNGGFFFWIYGYTSAAVGWAGSWAQGIDIVGIAEGFSRVDYSLSVESDYPSKGVSPIYVETGLDVDAIQYAIYEGELTATQINNKIAAISDGTDPSELFNEFTVDEDEAIKYATLEVSPEATGIYTLVAVALDAAKTAQNSASVSFQYISAEDEETYAVNVHVLAEDTPARYVDYHAYDSFAFAIYGSELTEVHVGIVESAKVEDEKDAAAYVLALKNDDEAAVSEEILAQINAAGGYYTVATGMKAATKYAVIVWATNGYEESVVSALYTTEKLPYVWNSLGKGTLTDGFFFALFSRDDATVPCDVYQEANNPGLYMITNYQLPLAAAFFGITTDDMAPYEGGNWVATELLIDASDPNAVSIPEQDYGVCVNSKYGFVQIVSNQDGVLADNAITFPVDGLGVGLGSAGWYDGNPQGTFKIALPTEQDVPNVDSSYPLAGTANAQVTNCVLSANAQKAQKPVVKFERDPKPVKASVNATASRKVKSKAKEFKTFENR